MKKIIMLSLFSVSSFFVLIFSIFSPTTNAQEAASQMGYMPIEQVQKEPSHIENYNMHHKKDTGHHMKHHNKDTNHHNHMKHHKNNYK